MKTIKFLIGVLLIHQSIVAQTTEELPKYLNYARRMLSAAEDGNIKEFEKSFNAFQSKLPINKNTTSLDDSTLFYYGIGLYYSSLFGIKADTNLAYRAIPFLNTCAKNGNYDCYYLLASLTKNNDTAFTCLKEAISGIRFRKYALHEIGLFYEKKIDTLNALKYYELASKEGNLISILTLAEYYFDIKKDYKNALKYYLKANKIVTEKDVSSFFRTKFHLAILFSNKIKTLDNLNENEAITCLKKIVSYLNIPLIEQLYTIEIKKLSKIGYGFQGSKLDEIDVHNDEDDVKYYTSFCYELIGKIYNKPKQIERNIDSAIHYYTLSFNIEKDTNIAYELADIYFNLKNDDSTLKYSKYYLINTGYKDWFWAEIVGLIYTNNCYSNLFGNSEYCLCSDSAYKYNNLAIKLGSIYAILNQINNITNWQKYKLQEAVELIEDAYNHKDGDKEFKINVIITQARIIENKQLSQYYNKVFNRLNEFKDELNLNLNLWQYVYYRYGYGTKISYPDAIRYLKQAQTLGRTLTDDEESFLKTYGRRSLIK
jgi:TPR repeat protein